MCKATPLLLVHLGAVMAWRAGERAVRSALKEDLEQFQGRDNNEEGGDDHEHGANPMPWRCRMLTNSGVCCAQ